MANSLAAYFADEGLPLPNTWACRWAGETVKLLPTHGLAIFQMLPSVEGGVGIAFWRHTQYADLEFCNSEEIVACLADACTEQVTVWTVAPTVESLSQALDRLQDFLASPNKDCRQQEKDRADA